MGNGAARRRARSLLGPPRWGLATEGVRREQIQCEESVARPRREQALVRKRAGPGGQQEAPRTGHYLDEVHYELSSVTDLSTGDRPTDTLQAHTI